MKHRIAPYHKIAFVRMYVVRIQLINIKYKKPSIGRPSNVLNKYLYTNFITYTGISLHTFIHKHTYTHLYIHTYIRTYVHIYIRTYMHIYMYTHTYKYPHTYIQSYIHTYLSHRPGAKRGERVLISTCVESIYTRSDYGEKFSHCVSINFL